MITSLPNYTQQDTDKVCTSAGLVNQWRHYFCLAMRTPAEKETSQEKQLKHVWMQVIKVILSQRIS